MKTKAAKCAAEIRQYLKAKGVKASVRSENYSMGDSVRVNIKEIIHPTVLKEIKFETSKYQYGHFDGMQDYYEYSNVNPNIPQTKFLFVEYDWKVQDAFIEAVIPVLKTKIKLDDRDAELEYKRLARGVLYGSDWASFCSFDDLQVSAQGEAA